MKTISGTVRNTENKPVANATVELYDENISLMDLIAGSGVSPLVTVKSEQKGVYAITVLDNFKGYVVVPSQTIKNCKVDFNYAITNETQINYNVVVKTEMYDIRDIDLSGHIELPEVVAWLRDLEAGKVKNMEYRISQLEGKLRMLVEIIIPLIMRK